MNNLVDQPWFVVEAPDGGSLWVTAGAAAAVSAAFICDVGRVTDGPRWRDRAQQLAGHIVKVHNTDLARRVVERRMGVRE